MEQKFCPLLTMAVIEKPEPQRVVAISGQKAPESGFEAVPCAGSMCMMFVPIFDDKGKPIAGNCAIALLPTAVGMLNQSVRNAAGLDGEKN